MLSLIIENLILQSSPVPAKIVRTRLGVPEDAAHIIILCKEISMNPLHAPAIRDEYHLRYA